MHATKGKAERGQTKQGFWNAGKGRRAQEEVEFCQERKSDEDGDDWR